MTLQDLLDAVYADCGYDPAPSPSVVKRLTRYLREGYQLILSMPEFTQLRSNSMPFTSVAGQTVYGWPQAFVSIEQVVNQTQNVRLRMMTLDQMRTLDPQDTSSGTPTHYVSLGLGPSQMQPNITHLWAVSDNALDTMNLSVFGASVRGFAWPRKTTPLNGITFVDVGGQQASDYITVQQVELSAAPAGFVYLFGAMAQPAAPAVANTGAGSYPATLRQYRVTYYSAAGTVVSNLTQTYTTRAKRQSMDSFITAFTPSGTGAAALITRPPLINEGETTWQVMGSTDAANYFVLSPELPITTLTYTDSVLPASYGLGARAPLPGVFLSTIARGQTTVQYQQVRLWPTPSQADDYVVDGIMGLADDIQTYDVPLIPMDFQLVLGDYARMREYEYRDDARFAMAQMRYEQKLKQMRNRLMDPPDFRPRCGKISDRGNNLDNGQISYPPGRW